jgi:hypothetical protein
MFKLDTSALETFSEKDQALLKENINLHGDVKKVLEDTQVPHHKQVQALEKIVSASHEKGSLFVHDINTQEQLEQLNKFGEIEIEMAKDKMRRDNISALQDKEDKKQLLNATKAGGMGAAGMGAAGMGTAGESGSGIGLAESYLVGKEVVPRILTGIRGLLGIGTITGTGAGTAVLTTTGAIAAGTAAIGVGAIAGIAALLGFTAYSIYKTGEFVKNLSQEDKDKKLDAIMGKGFMQRRREFDAMSPEEQKIELARRKQKVADSLFKGHEKKLDKKKFEIEHQQKVLESFKAQEKKLDKKTDVLMKEIERGKEKGAPASNIVTSVQDNKNIINHHNTNISSVNVRDDSRRVFGV